jgi:membrane-bound acyltransferase YfiQ involved in biofilm formation
MRKIFPQIVIVVSNLIHNFFLSDPLFIISFSTFINNFQDRIILYLIRIIVTNITFPIKDNFEETKIHTYEYQMGRRNAGGNNQVYCR